MGFERSRRVAGFAAALLGLASIGCTGRERGDDDDDADRGDGGAEEGRDAGACGDGGDEAGDGGDEGDASVSEEPCDPSRPFGAPERHVGLSASEDGEPWVSGDGLTIVMTHVDESFQIGLEMASRAARDEAFSTPTPVTMGAWSEGASQGSLSPDGGALYFMSGAEILRAFATGEAGVFSEPEVVDAGFPADTQYPEYPRAAAGSLYYSLRELNQRRSLYGYDMGDRSTETVLFDAGDIFTFAMSSNGRYLYVTFYVDSLEIYRAERETADDAFSVPERVEGFDLGDPDLMGFAVTGVTDDDCEVFGWTYDLSGTDSIWHAVRGR